MSTKNMNHYYFEAYGQVPQPRPWLGYTVVALLAVAAVGLATFALTL